MAAKTHYTDQECDDVGDLVSTYLLTKITADTIYTDPKVGFVIDTMAGTGGTLGSGGSGTLPTGWTQTRPTGDGTVTYAVSGPDASGQYTITATMTAGAANTNFTLTKSEALTFTTGDVIDGGATVGITSTTDDSTITAMYVDMGGGHFPKNAGGLGAIANWTGPHVWRAYPINQAAGGSSFNKRFVVLVAAGKTATVTLKGFFHVVREGSAAIAPVNTVAPVMGAVTVGGTPSASNGTWIGTATITYSQQFYLGEASIASDYVFQAGDVGESVTCFVTATNAAGSGSAQSDVVTVGAASTLAKWDSTVTALSPSQLSYSNGDSTVSNNANTSGARFARGLDGKTSGKWFTRLTLANGGTSRGIGLCLASIGGTTGGTNGTSRWVWTGTTVFTNSANLTMPANISTSNGDYEIAYDLDANLLWVRAAGGEWNNSGSADPATGTGGLDISGRGAAAAHVMGLMPNNTTASSTFATGTAPSGFTAL